MPEPTTKDADRRYQLLALRILAEFGAAIAVPAVLAAIVGTRLDAARGTGSRFLIVFLVMAFVLTAAYVRRRAIAYGKEYEEVETLNARKDERP